MEIHRERKGPVMMVVGAGGRADLRVFVIPYIFVCLIFVKNTIRILIGILLNLYIALRVWTFQKY